MYIYIHIITMIPLPFDKSLSRYQGVHIRHRFRKRPISSTPLSIIPAFPRIILRILSAHAHMGGGYDWWLFKIIGLFCKRALQNRRYSAKET